MEQSTSVAIEYLAELGFDANLIPTADGKRADLVLHDGDHEYVIEAKGRDVEQRWAELVEQAHSNGMATMARAVAPWAAISSMLTRAGKQLAETPAAEDAFRLIWVVALHDDDDFVLECVQRRLHGRAMLTVVAPGKLSLTTKSCFYYDENDFRRLRHVDAAVLCGRNGLKMFINSFAPRRARFRESRLYSTFSGANACCDPELYEQSGDAFVIGEDFVSTDAPNAAWAYLKNKYGVLTGRMTEAQFNAVAVLPGVGKPEEPG